MTFDVDIWGALVRQG